MTSKTCHGLPWFNKDEKKFFDKRGYVSVYAAGVKAGRPLYIGRTGKVPERMTDLKSACNGDLVVHYVLWTPGDPLARRVLRRAEDLLDKTGRRLSSTLFDITPELAKAVIQHAGQQAGVPVMEHARMLEEVRTAREAQIDAAVGKLFPAKKFDWCKYEGIKPDEGRVDLDLGIYRE